MTETVSNIDLFFSYQCNYGQSTGTVHYFLRVMAKYAPPTSHLSQYDLGLALACL